jgi:hypothetical protein
MPKFGWDITKTSQKSPFPSTRYIPVIYWVKRHAERIFNAQNLDLWLKVV